jgi:hypothetical protein
MKKIGLALLCLLLACGVSAMVLFGIWNQYNPTAIIGSSVRTEKTDLKEVTEQWFDDFFKQYEGLFVPFEFRIKEKRVKTIAVLNKEDGFVQLDYEFKPASDNPYVTSYYTATLQENGWHVAQVVLQLEKTLNGYTVKNKMSPVQYQIQTDPSLREPPTTHYAMDDKKETYAFSQNQLYVTYDAGKSFTEVPVPYEDIAGTNNSTYNELLPAHGYIVSRDFTAFVCYDDTGSYLLYSKDMGKTWKKSRILPVSYRGDSLYLSKTESSCYITLATDRSLGHEYYSTYKSTDLKTWDYLKGEVLTEKRDVVFISDGTAYVSAGTDEQGNPLVYYTEDDGNTYTTLTIPAHEVKILGSSFKPFVHMEYVYQKKGTTYMIVAQGTDADYMKDGALVKGRYKSKDGITFTFDKEINDSPTLAG